MPQILEGVSILNAAKPGPTLAIFAGVHGNEKAGVEAIKEILPTLKLTKGKLYLVIANPPAVAKNVRQVSKNLNRCFLPGNVGTLYEDKRAHELMKILDRCEALLDLHGFEDKKGNPFIICEKESIKLAKVFDPSTISIGWVKAEPGATDGYMHQKGKIGICFESGPISDFKNAKKLAVKTIFQFLKFYDMTDEHVAFSKTKKHIVKVKKAVIRISQDYKLDKKLNNFDRLKAGGVYGSQNGQDFVASEGEFIIFPRHNPPIGAEAFLIGQEV